MLSGAANGTSQRFFQDFGQGRSKLYYLPESKAYDKLGEPGICSIVQHTISMCSMLMLGGLGAYPSQENLEK